MIELTHCSRLKSVMIIQSPIEAQAERSMSSSLMLTCEANLLMLTAIELLAFKQLLYKAIAND